MAISETTWTFQDYGKEKASVGVHSTLITAGNIAAQAAFRTALLVAIQAVTNGSLQTENVVASLTKFDNPPPTDPESWRRKKWLVSAVDTNGNAVTFHIPTAVPSVAYLSPGTNEMDLTSTEGLALVAAAEDFAKSNDGEAITVISITFVDK